MPPNRDQKQRLLGFARDMRQAPSDAERNLWQALRRKQLDGLKFRRQDPIGPFIADFVCEECKLVVELDGWQHDDAVEYDERRTLALNAWGYRVIRFNCSDVVRDLQSVVDTLLRECRPSP